MFHLSTTKFSRSITTLLEVLQLFRNDSHFRAVDAADVSLSHAGHPMCVTKFDGKLTVRMSGSMPDLFLAMLDEIDGAYFRPNGKLLEPWQIRPAHWQLLFFAFELSTRPLYLFTSEQVISFANLGSPSLFQVCEKEARARFGFGAGGPPVALGSGQVNGRHEVHLAYALAAGVSVPEAVLADYGLHTEPFGNDIRWARVLLTVPELRGAMPVAKLRVLVSVMTHSRQAISSANAAVLAMVARLLPNEPTYVEVDDLLCRHGLLDARALPETYFEAVDIGAPVSPFATVLRRIMADERKSSTLERLEARRAAREISQREYDLHQHLAALDHGRSTFEFPNRMATAIANADMHQLLDILDRPDDANRWTKKAVREFYGVKLTGITAKARRRAIFALAGLDEAQQLEWEQRADASRIANSAARDVDRAKARAESARYRYGNKVITGVQHVEQSIASGFSKITSYRYGASQRYSLVAPAHDGVESRTLRANDGTLAYAQYLLSQGQLAEHATQSS
ncbi:hypothetical protein LJR034_008656 [Caballeronia sp. LjRoot34]|uniref:hypothetical protein n=1 Tax=Caballeronia sp. LjRoot34 TaxID=3342325 RepID=UPI003ECE5375